MTAPSPRQKRAKNPPPAFSFGPFRRFKVRAGNDRVPCIMLSTRGRTKISANALIPHSYVMYWPGDFRKLEKFQRWLARAVEYVDAQGPSDTAQRLGFREYPAKRGLKPKNDARRT